MTSAGSVGTGVARPLALASEFLKKFGTRAHASAFVDFLRARKVSRQEALEVQEALLRHYNVHSVGLQLPDDILEAKGHSDPTAQVLKTLVKTVAAAVASKGAAPTPGAISFQSAPSPRVGAHAPSQDGPAPRNPVSFPGAASAPSSGVRPHRHKKKKKRHVHEGLGYADDSDGRGGGVSGGSAYDATWQDGGGTAKEQRCPRCNGSLQGRTCPQCGDVGDIQTSGSQGSPTQPVFGNVRVPGGPVDTNEAGGILIRSLGPLMEIEVDGVRTTHSRQVAFAALDNRLSVYGVSYRPRIHKVVEWLWTKAQPGDELVLDLYGEHQYVLDRNGFKYNYHDDHD